MKYESAPKGAQESATTSLIVAAGTDSALEARRRRDQVKLLLTRMTEQTNMVGNILEEAQTAGDHLTLGYESWPKYIVGEYAGKLADLDRAKRREVVGSLTAAGMSTRAIAGVVGTSHKTVVKDLQVQVVPRVPPDLVDHQDGVDRRVTGLDGKTYSKTRRVALKPVVEPKERRRGPLPDDYWRALHNLDKAARRLAKLHADDRFMANRKALYGRYDSWLSDIDALVSSMDSDLSITGGNKCQDCDERMLPSVDFETTCKTCRGESR